MEWTVVKFCVCLCTSTTVCQGQDLVNVVRGKPCSQSSLWNVGRPASFAANGDTGTEFTDTNCMHSFYDDYNPWWEVDLGRTYPVYNITIYARARFSHRLTNSKITVDGVECHSIGRQSPPDVYSFNCGQVLFGRRVRIARKNKTNDIFLNMCEFQIWVWSEYASCSVGRTGNDCSFNCSLSCGGGLGKNLCSQSTATCFGCSAGRHGDYCDKDCDSRCKDSVCNRDGSCLINVALNQQASMSSRGSDSGPAGNAVNGDRGSDTDDTLYPNNCIKTGSGDRQPWWQVDLGRKYPVHSITISALRFNQYRIVPSVILVEDRQCYSYDNLLNSRTPRFQCSSTLFGQVVKIQRDYNDYELAVCEMEVWVCTPGFYGDDCDSRCKVDQCAFCDQKNGSACYECQPGWYDTDCSLPCQATSCKARQCDRQSGLCTQCDGNYGGSYCTDCISGFYGTDCNLACRSAACLGGMCDRTTGWCSECPAGRWGDGCTLSCQSGCGGTGQCDQDTGDCLSCASRRWGARCGHTCPEGCGGNRECDVQTGHCLSCSAGFWGHYCNSTCLSDKCRDNVCNVTTGLCNACWVMTYGELPFCECTDGYYYNNRQCLPCPGTCYQNGPCNKTTGHCDRCPPGRQGDHCKRDCPVGSYGQDCAEQCGQCSEGETTCDAETGHCVNCKPGWTSPFCNGASDQEKGDGNSSLVGPVVGSVVGTGVLIAVAVILAAFIIRSRKTSADSGVSEVGHKSRTEEVNLTSVHTQETSKEESPAKNIEEDPYDVVKEDENTEDGARRDSKPRASASSDTYVNNYEALAPQYENSGDVKPYDSLFVSSK